MNFEDIETFLELVRTRNISKAADHLYLSQSTVSNRLKNLENELGFQLFLRGKGRAAIELTRRGDEFIPIAERWKGLYEETELLRDESHFKLKIASAESSYFTLIGPFIRKFSEENPNVRFDVRICDSEQIYKMVMNGQAHFGFVSYEADYTGMIREELLAQKLCVIMKSEESGNVMIDPATLDPNKEVRFTGGQFTSMELLHEKWFGKKTEAALTINVGIGAIQHMQNPGAWSVVPIRMAQYLSHYSQLRIFTLREQPEEWKVYCIYRKDVDKNKQKIFKSFRESLLEYLEAQDETV